MKHALILCDLINEIVHPAGKFKDKGYAAFVQERQVLDRVRTALAHARRQNFAIVHVKVGFSPTYVELPRQSPLFGKAQEFGALKLASWATEFHEAIDVQSQDLVITKHRISPFYDTGLDAWLRENEVTTAWIGGCATDLVVSSAARDAHDRDFSVRVLDDCCAAATTADHENALAAIKKLAAITSSKCVADAIIAGSTYT